MFGCRFLKLSILRKVEQFLERNFYPDIFVNSVEHINLGKLKASGYDTLLFDLDNTLVGWRDQQLSPEVANWLEEAHSLHFKMCIVSNSLGRRVKRFSKHLGIPAISKAIKPKKKAFLNALKLLSSKPHRTVVIGDQVFTDVFGGKRMGLYTILVIPVDRREFFTTFIFRMAEKVVLRFFHRKQKA